MIIFMMYILIGLAVTAFTAFVFNGEFGEGFAFFPTWALGLFVLIWPIVAIFLVFHFTGKFILFEIEKMKAVLTARQNKEIE